MAMVIGKPGLRTFYLMEILLTRSDEENPLNSTALQEILLQEYDVTINRTTVYTEIEKLQDCGLDIVLGEGRRKGWYIASRQFELAELKLLVDAVQSSKFITEKKSRELIRKLEALCSRNEAKQLGNQVTIYRRAKTSNETIYYNVDMIHTAIYQNRQIAYQYVDWTVRKQLELRHGGAVYEVSPLHLIWDDENYYLIAYDEKAGKVKHYRVDKMRGMQILETGRSPEALAETIDVADFSKKTFGMFGGEDISVRLAGKNHMAGVILDRFGTDIWMRPLDAEHFTAQVTVTVSPQFFGWLTAVGQDLQITGPEEVKERYAAYLREILGKYGDKE